MGQRKVVGALALLLVASGGGLLGWHWWYDGRVMGVTTEAEDLERVKSTDINTHFRSVFGRNPTVGEWRYWFQRTKDTPLLYKYLEAMRHHAGSGGSPSIDDKEFAKATTALRLHPSTAGRYLFAGDKVNFAAEVTNSSELPSSGVLNVLVSAGSVDNIGLGPVNKTTGAGKTLIRYRYTLAKDEKATQTFQITVPAAGDKSLFNVRGEVAPSLEVRAWIDDLQGLTSRQFRVVSALSETEQGTTYNDEQVVITFLKVYDRKPTGAEVAHWRSRLKALDNKLGALQGAMEVAQREEALNTIEPAEINGLFREVYGRAPTQTEWQYWADRRTKTPKRQPLLDAMKYHQAQGWVH